MFAPLKERAAPTFVNETVDLRKIEAKLIIKKIENLLDQAILDVVHQK